MGITLRENSLNIENYVLHFVYEKESQEQDKLPLIMLHGANPEFNSWKVWEYNMEALAEVVTPYAVDLIGYGQSSKGRLGTQKQAEIIVKMAEQLQLTQIGICGLSWGASVANEVVKLIPDKISLILFVSAAVRPGNLADQIKEGKFPVIIAWCPEDPVIPITNGKNLHQAIPNSVFIEIPAPKDFSPKGKAHHPQSLNPVEFNKKIVSALKDILTSHPV